MSAVEEETRVELAVVEPETYTPARIVGGIPHLEQYLTLAQHISRTAMVPSALRNKPDEVLAVIMYGAELGIGPMQALQQINFIAGKPSAAAELLRALVMEAGHQFILDSNPEVATATCRRKDWDEWRTTTFTIEDAKRANLVRGDGWTKYPDQMLAARVTSKACRMFFPDVISGMSYTPEEVEAFSPPPARTRREPAPTTTVRSAPVVDAEIVETGEAASPEMIANIVSGIESMTPEERAQAKEAWGFSQLPPLAHGLTAVQASQAWEIVRRVLDAGDAQISPPEAEVAPGPTDDGYRGVAADRAVDGATLEPPKVSKAQVGKIRVLMGQAGVDPADIHTRASDIVRRQVESLNDLTKAEASRVIDQLMADVEG